MTKREALNFVKEHGVVLMSARGDVPNLAEAVAGEKIKGSWWGHAKGNEIHNLSGHVRSSDDILVCRLVRGKVTFVHRRLWPALVAMSDNFTADQLASIQEIHTKAGNHIVESTPYPKWVPDEIFSAATSLSLQQAELLLSDVLLANAKKPR